MLSLLLIGLFVAFGLAVLEKVISFLSIFVTAIVINSVTAIGLSALACFLLDNKTDKSFYVYTISGAFLGRALLAIVEGYTEHRRVTVNTVR